MIGAIDIDLFHLQVGVFADEESRCAFLKEHGVDPIKNSHYSTASAHMDCAPNGMAWFSLVVTPEATMAVWAHECVHIADFAMERLGIPTDAANTEVRGYLVAHLFSGLQGLMEGKA